MVVSVALFQLKVSGDVGVHLLRSPVLFPSLHFNPSSSTTVPFQSHAGSWACCMIIVFFFSCAFCYFQSYLQSADVPAKENGGKKHQAGLLNLM